MEIPIETQTDLYLCFIGYTKAFDNVKHEVITILEDININGQHLRIIERILTANK